MDEAEKYKQRLEAIAEKRRQQDEQDRARREMEDEKLRLQQLKRKSLRDQWLMEGAPLSPAFPDAQSPCSHLRDSQAEEIEKHIDKLQSESQRLAEEKEKEQMEDGQMEAVKVSEAGAEMVQDVVVQNGENNATASETTEDEVKTNKSPLLDETAVVLTNGGGDLDAETSHKASEQGIQSNSNGPISVTEGVVNMKLEPGLSLGVSGAESDRVQDVNINEEEEEGTLVIRAECVIITDEGDYVPQDLRPQEDQQEAMQSEETPLPNQEAGNERGGAVEEVIKTEAALKSFTQPEKSEETEPTAEAQPATGDGNVEGDVKTNENGDGETKAEGQDKKSEDRTSVQLQSPAAVLEGTTVPSVPVYSEAQPSTLTPKAEGEAAMSPGGAEAALKAQDRSTMPGQFQEVPLADPQENQRTEVGLGEQEPLLSQAKAPNAQAKPAATNSPANKETHSPTRGSQGEETEAPKGRACQCCSVM
ncbi:paralemmin-3 isoform X2 [Xiphias gladius]|uniref:paralemmin-3 isoform X2 n=1 Tax=Xiphias gladius TaxID=8245 RepID=UPI001A98C678|nr:paralemmin-3 isoform X2 [Xiphias gladius]